MSKNKGFSRVMALVLLICMVVSFAPAAYADVDETPAVQEEALVGGDKISIGGGNAEIQAPIGSGRLFTINPPECNNTDCDAYIEIMQDGKVIATVDKTTGSKNATTSTTSPVTLVAHPGEECGCEFVKWTKGSTLLSNDATCIVLPKDVNSIPRTLTAHFNKEIKSEYTVTYTDGVGGSVFANQVYTVAAGAATPAFDGKPTRDGYTFNGWSPAVAATVTKDVTYVAQWKGEKYTVTYTDGVGGSVFADQSYTVAADSATPAFVGELTREGYSFLGWDPAVAATVTKDITYTAKWVAEKYTLTFNGNGAQLQSAAAGSYTPNTTYTKGTEIKLASVMTGKTFVKDLSSDYSTNYRQTGWNTEKDGSGTHYDMNGTLTMPASNVTLYAEWEAYEWIHWNATVGEGGESITIHEGVTGATAKTGTSFKLYTGNVGTGYGKVPALYYTPVEATAKDGYYFVGWYDVAKDALVSANSGLYTQDFRDLRALTRAESGSVLEARFAKLLTVTYTDGVDGEEVFADQVYSVKPGEATPEFVGIPTRTNYDFKGWEPEVSATVTGNVIYTAKWEPSTKKMPKNITEADVNQMQIRAYAEGTESYSSINEMLSCSPRIYAKGVEYTINPVVGNDVDGYTTSVTFHFKRGDQLEAGAISVFNTERGLGYYSDWEKWTGNWSYDFDEYTGAANNGKTRPADQTLNLKWVITVNPRTGKETGAWKALDKNGNFAGNNTAAIANVIQVNLKLERTVTYTDGVNGTVFADQVYTVANGATAPAFNGTPTREGYKFAGWEPAVNATTKIYADTTYTAQWVALYTVTYTDGVDGEEVFADEVYTDIESGSATPAFTGSTERLGWKFNGWKPAVAETVTEDVTYVAQWKTKGANTLYYDANGGEGGPVNNFSNAIYATVSTDKPTREGYAFTGWNTKADGTGDSYKGGDKYYFLAAHNGEKVTLYAQWVKTYTVTYSDGVNGEAFASESYEVVENSSTPAFTGSTEREGYVFKGWAPAVAETVTGNVTYVAQWVALYTVTYTDGVDGEEIFADQSTTVEDGSKTPAFNGTPERAGYTFAGWAPEVAETVTENVTYTAQWTANDYTLSRDSNGGDELADVTVTTDKPYGDAVVASPRAGYTEDGWFLVVDKTVTDTEITADSVVKTFGDHGIYLKRSIAPAALTVSEDVTKDYDGEEVTLTASTDEYTGLVYSYQWYKDGEEIEGATGKTLTLDGNVADSGVYTVKVIVTNAEDSGVVTENESVTAEAEVKVVINKINNSLTYNYNGADEEDSTVETIESTVTVDADKEITRKGYDFLGWNTKADGTGDSYKSGDELTFVDNGNGGEAVTLYAQWKGKEYKLTFKIKDDPDFKEDVKLNFTSKTVVYGEKVGQFPYATRKDHILVWYDKDGKRVNSETIYLVEGDSTYTGVWTEYKPVVATGDSSNIALYAAAMFASIACIGAGVILLRRKREE